jgi:hypothetical protein
MKNIWSIINGVAWQHGISDPSILEGGQYPPDQARVLRKMGKKCLKKKTPESFYLYIQQKAKFITGT